MTHGRRDVGATVRSAAQPPCEKRAAAAARAALPESRRFTYTFERCRSTVRTLRHSRSAISSLLSPVGYELHDIAFAQAQIGLRERRQRPDAEEFMHLLLNTCHTGSSASGK